MMESKMPLKKEHELLKKMDGVGVRPMMIEPSFAVSMPEDITVDAYTASNQPQSNSFSFASDSFSGVSVVPVHGYLDHRSAYHYPEYYTGYMYIRALVQGALDDNSVSGIVLDLSSGGGRVDGAFELMEFIKEASLVKPIVGIIDGICCSACYLIASACSHIYMNDSGVTGSIGVIMSHTSVKRAMDMAGYDVTFIQDGEAKAETHFYKELTDEAKARLEVMVKRDKEKFVKAVSKNLNIEESVIIGTKSAILSSEDALELGLIHSIMPPLEAYQDFALKLNEGVVMPKKEEIEENTSAFTQATQDSASSVAVANERVRIEGIINCEEAVGREALASHLALKGGMSIEDAKGILANSEKKAVAQVATTESNAFEAAMSANGTPAIDGGSGLNDGESGEQDATAEEFLNAHKEMVGG
jgi:signal peptide peptidase SppA